jgi:excinuclease UvrABC nuclease subunit
MPRSFNASAIREHAPARSGVYGISNAQEWIYIGESDNIRETLMDHLADAGPSRQLRPTGFVYEVCEREVRISRQDRLVLEYEPVRNRLLTDGTNYRLGRRQ